MNARTWALCALLAIGAGPATIAAPPRAASLPGDSVYRMPLELTDHHARTWDWRTKRGQPQVVAMFYTSCPYVCPLIIDGAKAIERGIPAAQRPQLGFLLISLDPRHDTPDALADVARKRGLHPARWSLASPQPDKVRSAAGVLGVRYRELDDGNFNHTSALVLLDTEGRIVASTTRFGGRPDPEFMAAVRSLLVPAKASPPGAAR